MLTREDILSVLERALKPIDQVYALWEAGAAAFDRIDQWSDIDLMVVVHDDYVAQTWEVIEGTLKDCSPIDLRFELPQPTWHGHSQVFYRLKDTSPFLFIDALVKRRVQEQRARERQNPMLQAERDTEDFLRARCSHPANDEGSVHEG
jgi:predicted nucleotidyltransferase